MPLSSCESKVINEFVESYKNARNDPIPDFGPDEFTKHMALLSRIKSAIIPRVTQSKANSPLNLNKRKTSKGSNLNQAFTLKVSPTKVSTFQTHIVQDDSKRKDNETCV